MAVFFLFIYFNCLCWNPHGGEGWLVMVVEEEEGEEGEEEVDG